MKNETVVIKLGGSLLGELPDAFFQQCAALKRAGVQLVVVHGGGPKINAYMERLALPATFSGGLRVTDAPTLELVEMVLAGTLNKQIVSRLEGAGAAALGISGVDRGLLRVQPYDKALGYVGRVDRVRVDVLRKLSSSGWIPVVASLGVDAQGQHYNVNADSAAGAIATALAANKLVFATDVPGILARDGQTLKQVTPQQLEQLIEVGTIADGMIPKAQAVLTSVAGNVAAVCIGDGKHPDMLQALYTGGGEAFPGTRVVVEGSETNGVNGDVYALADYTR
ncbi:acetylglutamate kinase [Numidum massiliense]|uniref:acetylglutamate kinase n=1 Tax=Numidum massiliense TaxID=1522315 RepID=UPI0006D59641|nr:acetylglutamate kinase [Numidum massiliense]